MADGTADVVWAAGVVWAVVAAAGVLIQRPCMRNGSEMGKEACRHVTAVNDRIEDFSVSENTFAS